MMGHKSIKTTQIYAKITNQKIYQEMKTLNKTNLIKLSKIG
jgi:site-specific recombinase XerD